MWRYSPLSIRQGQSFQEGAHVTGVTEGPEVGEEAEGGSAWLYDQGGRRVPEVGGGCGWRLGGRGHGSETLTPSDNNALFPL